MLNVKKNQNKITLVKNVESSLKKKDNLKR